MTLSPGRGGRERDRLKLKFADQPSTGGTYNCDVREACPATGCEPCRANASALLTRAVESRDNAPRVSGRSNSLLTTVNGFSRLLSRSDVLTVVRNGSNSAVSVCVLPRNNE